MILHPSFHVIAGVTSADVASYGYMRGVGHWRGTTEPVYVVYGADESEILDLARRRGQTAVLAVDSGRYGLILYTDRSAPEPVGRWRETAEPDQHDAWTQVQGRYFACR